jgi:hypothetical protein
MNLHLLRWTLISRINKIHKQLQQYSTNSENSKRSSVFSYENRHHRTLNPCNSSVDPSPKRRITRSQRALRREEEKSKIKEYEEWENEESFDLFSKFESRSSPEARRRHQIIFSPFFCSNLQIPAGKPSDSSFSLIISYSIVYERFHARISVDRKGLES